MTTYYVRHDGTQTNKDSAVLGTSAATSLSIAGLNGETFAAGDTVIFRRSGTYTTTLTISGTGTAEAPITFMGDGPDETEHAVVSVGAGSNGISVVGDHLQVRNFSVTNVDNKCFYVGVNTGIGGHTLKFFDCIAVANPGGDGFGTSSPGGDLTEIEFIRCEARAISGTGNQGFTIHDEQLCILTDCSTTSACETSMGMVGTYCEVNGGTFEAFRHILFASQGCRTVINDAILTATAAVGSAVADMNQDGSTLVCNRCVITHGGASTASNNIKHAGASMTFNDGSFTYAALGTSGFEYTGDGLVTFNRVNITVTTMGARLLRTVAGGGRFRFLDNLITLTAVGGSGTRILIESRATSNGVGSRFIGNVVVGGSMPTNFILMRTNDGTVATIYVCNNVFYRIDGTTTAVYTTLKTTGTGASFLFNNIFYGCTNAVSGSNGLTRDGNNYSNSTPNEGDTRGTTVDPEFASATPVTRKDFDTRYDSPLRRAGVGYLITGGAFYTSRGRRLRMPPDVGAIQHR